VSAEENRHKPSLDTIKNHIIEDLKEKYAEGLIGVREFETLLEKTQQVQTREELAELAEQLPDVRKNEDSTRTGKPRGATDTVDTVVTFMGENRRDGVWRPARHIKVLVVMGDVDLDFTEALLPDGTVFVDFISVMADIDVVVPEGVNVEFGGTPLLSSHKNKTSKRYYEGGPTIKLSGFSLMADVVVKER
jgi:hypothetical protein